MSRLTHEVSVSLSEGSMCPSCGDSRLVHDGSGRVGRGLACAGCGFNEPVPFTRWRMLYPMLPDVSHRDVFHSMEIIDSSGQVRVRFVLDIDTGRKEDLLLVHERLKEVAGDAFDIYHSGNKGYHLEIPFETWNFVHPVWGEVYRGLCEHLDILGVVDTSIFARNALIRAPGTFNSKGNKHKNLLHKASEEPGVAWIELLEKLGQSVDQTAASRTNATSSPPDASLVYRKLLGYTPPCVLSMELEGIPSKGSRHQVYLHLASYYLRSGASEEECLSNLEQFAEDFSENTNSSLNVRLADARAVTTHAYSSQRGIAFECSRAQDLGVCEPSCKLFK